MNQDFDVARNVYIDTDLAGTVTQLRHLGSPVNTAAATPQLAATEYLLEYGDLLQLGAKALDNLGSSPSELPEQAGVELRFVGQKSQFDSETVTYSQTVLGLPVFEAGVSVQLQTNPFRVVSYAEHPASGCSGRRARREPSEEGARDHDGTARAVAGDRRR